MIYMKQNKLSRLCNIMNDMESQYLFCLQYGINDIVNWFNTYWISTASKQIADELRQYLNSYTKEISKTFNDLNNKIKKEVILYNRNPEIKRNIYYKGFSISKPYNINDLANLNKTLPDGKIGSLPKETDITYPINRLKILSEEITSTLKRAIIKCDAISYGEQETIICSIISKERRFRNSIEDILQIILKKYY